MAMTFPIRLLRRYSKFTIANLCLSFRMHVGNVLISSPICAVLGVLHGQDRDSILFVLVDAFLLRHTDSLLPNRLGHSADIPPCDDTDYI